jgi:hypothetical protein
MYSFEDFIYIIKIHQNKELKKIKIAKTKKNP